MRKRMSEAQREAFRLQAEKNARGDITERQAAHRRSVADPATSPARKRAAPRVWTPGEVKEQERAVEVLLTNAVDEAGIVTALRNKWGISYHRAKRLIGRVRDRWVEESQVNGYANKVEAEKRLLDGIREARKDRKWSAVASFERTLANLQGTLEPIRIDVGVRQHGAILEIMGSMTGEELERLAGEAEESRRVHEAWRRGALPAVADAIVVDEEPAAKANGAAR